MEIYIILYGLLFFSAFLDSRKSVGVSRKSVGVSRKSIRVSRKSIRVSKIHIVYFFVIIFTLFRGLRWETGTDWVQYHDVFYNVSWNNIFKFYRYDGNYSVVLEYGYVLLNLIVRTVTGNYTFFLLITNFFILWTYAKASLKLSPRPILCFIGFLMLDGFFPVRQHIAIAIVIWAFRFAINRSLIKFVLTVYIASTIHSAAIILFPFYFLIKIKLNYWSYIVILFCSIITIQVLSPIMFFVMDRVSFLGDSILWRLIAYSTLTKEDTWGLARSSFNITFNFILFTIYYYIVATYTKDDQRKNFLWACLNMFLVESVIRNMFSETMQELGRVGSFFSLIGGPILMAELINAGICGKLRKIRIVFIGTFVLFMWYRFYKFTLVHPLLMFPYKSIFDYL